jgi:hypothetical protein
MYDLKWKRNTFSMELDVAVLAPPNTPNNQVFEKHLVAYNVLRGTTQNAITPKKADSKALLHGWWKYWRQQGTRFLQGEPSKMKDHDLQKIFDIYILQAYSVAFYLKCKMAFHLECTNCRSHREESV